jgi:predicted Zn finger-like uncharacterized protein
VIVTRCPHCDTGFRVTPEQIKLRGGRVRCGECAQVFDALENLLTVQGVMPTTGASGDLSSEQVSPAGTADAELSAASPFLVESDAPAPAPEMAGTPASPGAEPAPAEQTQARADYPAIPAFLVRQPLPTIEQTVVAPNAPTAENELVDGGVDGPLEAVVEAPLADSPATASESLEWASPERDDALVAAPDDAVPDAPPVTVIPQEEALPAAEKRTRPAGKAAGDKGGSDAPERAREVGLSAARETRAVPGYNKWAEGALTSSGSGFAEPPQRLRWPFALAAVLFLAVLAGQLGIHFRSQLAAQWPASVPALTALCDVAGCQLGLPRQSEFISIEASELQSDPERNGLLVLQATLRNRAGFAQAMPALELALTDLRDQPIVRKVLLPEDYLGGGQRQGLAPGADLPVRLWLNANGVGAAGYRLYVFYP